MDRHTANCQTINGYYSLSLCFLCLLIKQNPNRVPIYFYVGENYFQTIWEDELKYTVHLENTSIVQLLGPDN